MKTAHTLVIAMTLGAGLLLPSVSQAHVDVHFSVGVPGVVMAPAPVVVAPAQIVVTEPAPVVVTQPAPVVMVPPPVRYVEGPRFVPAPPMPYYWHRPYGHHWHHGPDHYHR